MRCNGCAHCFFTWLHSNNCEEMNPDGCEWCDHAQFAFRDGAPTKHHRSICGGCAYCGDPSSVERLGPSTAKDPSGHRLLEPGERPGKAIVRLREAQKDERALANCF